MSTCKKGLEFERRFSRRFHRHGRALLVSPLVLRELGLGQIDAARLVENRIEICELKLFGELSWRQKTRLMRSASYLGELLDKEVRLKLERP